MNGRQMGEQQMGEQHMNGQHMSGQQITGPFAAPVPLNISGPSLTARPFQTSQDSISYLGPGLGETG